MSNITSILTRVAEIQLTIANGSETVKAAYPYIPADPSSAALPFFANSLRGGPTAFMASGVLQHVTSTVVMDLAISRKEGDATVQVAAERVLGWRDAVFTTFARKVKLSDSLGQIDLTFVLQAHITQWDIDAKTIGTAEYLVVTFDLSVDELFPLSVGA